SPLSLHDALPISSRLTLVLEGQSDGFAYRTGHTLTPVSPLTGGATFLRHPIAWLLQDQVPRTPHTLPKEYAQSGWLVSPASPGTRTRGYGNINPLSIDYA